MANHVPSATGATDTALWLYCSCGWVCTVEKWRVAYFPKDAIAETSRQILEHKTLAKLTDSVPA